MTFAGYSGVPIKRAARLLIFEEKIHKFMFIKHYIAVNKNACR